jgi:hypothetical protein
LEYARRLIGDNVVAYYGNETVEDTIRIFSRACVIIGVHGAGFANIVFSRPRTLAIEITVPLYRLKSNFTLIRSNEELVRNTEFFWHKYVVEWDNMRQPSRYMESFNRTNLWEFALHLDRVHIENILQVACSHLQTWFGIGLCRNGAKGVLRSHSAGKTRSKMQLLAQPDGNATCSHVAIMSERVPLSETAESPSILVEGIPLKYSFNELAKWKFGERRVVEVGPGETDKELIHDSCMIIKLAGEPAINAQHLNPKALVIEIDRIPDLHEFSATSTGAYDRKRFSNRFAQTYFVDQSEFDLFFKDFIRNSSFYSDIINDSMRFRREHVMNILRIACMHINLVVGSIFCRNENSDNPSRTEFKHDMVPMLPTKRFVSLRDFSVLEARNQHFP